MDALNNWDSTSSVYTDAIKPLYELLINPNFDDALDNNQQTLWTDYDKIVECVREHATWQKSEEQYEMIMKSIEDERNEGESDDD